MKSNKCIRVDTISPHSPPGAPTDKQQDIIIPHLRVMAKQQTKQ